MGIGSSELKWNASFQGPAGERYLFMVYVRIMLVLLSLAQLRADDPSFRNDVMAVLAKAVAIRGRANNAKGRAGFSFHCVAKIFGGIMPY